MNTKFNDIFDAWRESRNLTLDFAKSLTSKQLRMKQDRPGLNSIGMHLLEMADVTAGYANSFSTGIVDFNNVKDTYADKEQEPETIISALEHSDELVVQVIKKLSPGITVSAFGEDLSAEAILLLLLRHENMHHGQLIAFAFASQIKLPDSWVDSWALPRHEN